ncbi:uncharacterized protein V1516DRAFT_670368 [Lipomyces oligophaga]|uniref:uncharacterized protein n=1 Tax=Lipomyces oligophaga TaxID=45792 RepID=UPI0034CE6898
MARIRSAAAATSRGWISAEKSESWNSPSVYSTPGVKPKRHLKFSDLSDNENDSDIDEDTGTSHDMDLNTPSITEKISTSIEVANTLLNGYYTAEEYEESSDEAPEDVSLSATKLSAIAARRARDQEVSETRIVQRLKRSATASKLTSQKRAKLERKEVRQRRLQNQQLFETTEDDLGDRSSALPLLLPQNILANISTTVDTVSSSSRDDSLTSKERRPSKKVFTDSSKPKSINAGEVTIQILAATKLKTLAPPATKAHLKSRSKWLNRKSVRHLK